MKNKKAKQNNLEKSKELALHFMKTLVEVARESFLILDHNLRVISANETFYHNFIVNPAQTENKFLYELGNHQWDIPELKKLMEDILPQKEVVKDYKVVHVFEIIGKRTMLLNARQVDAVKLIILAIEDITEKKELESQLVEYTKELENKVAERTRELDGRIKELEIINKTMINRELKIVELKEEIEDLKRLIKNGSGNHKNGR